MATKFMDKLPTFNSNSTYGILKSQKTPADEAIAFFESPYTKDEEPVRVYELSLDADGGPNKDRSVGSIRIHQTHALTLSQQSVPQASAAVCSLCLARFT